MSWGHAALDLEEDADERAVKRAYAKRLRTTRPDDDPVGFQQLHEAYQAALGWAQYRAQWQDEEDDEGGHQLSPMTVTGAAQGPQLDDAMASSAAAGTAPAPVEEVMAAANAPAAHDPVRTLDDGDTPYPAAAHADPSAPDRVSVPLQQPAAPPVDPDVCARRIINEAQQSEPPAFERWLQLRPELWSLRDKPLIGDAVLAALLSREVPIHIGNFELLSQCFGWNEVGSGLDPYDADACRLRLHRLWVLQPRNHAALGRFLHRDGVPLDPEKARIRLDRLTRPWARWPSLWSACWPERVNEMRDTLARLDIHDASAAPPPLRREQVAFWLALADGSTLGWVRMQVALLRSALLAAIVMAVVPLLGMLVNLTPTRRSGGFIPPLGMPEFVQIGLLAAAVVLALGAVLPALRAIAQWQVGDEDPSVRWPLLKLWLIPLLAVTALLVIHPADARVAGSALAWLTLGLSIRRWWHRAGYVFQFSGWLLLGIWPFLKLGGLALMFGEIAIVGALLAWTVDAMTKVVRR
jgi:hypothetical protein